MKNLIIIVSDINYINHAKSLISNIINEGKHKGDICLISNVENDVLSVFEKKGIIIFKVDEYFKLPYNYKYFILDSFFKKWDKILYIDCDTMILDNISDIFNLENDIYCCEEYNLDKSRCVIDDHFNHKLKNFSIEDYDYLSKKYDFKKYSFNSGIMLLNSNVIEKESKDDILKLNEEIKNINNHVHTGTDQPVFNIYFKEWQNFPNNLVSYWTNCGDNTKIIHFYRWCAPWEPNLNFNKKINNLYYNIYLNNLENFEKIRSINE